MTSTTSKLAAQGSGSLDIDAIVSAMRQALGVSEPVVLHEPRFRGSEWDYVKRCLDTGWVSSVGEYVDQFERDLAAYLGAKHAIAVVNGTAALHVSLLLSGVEAGSEVLTPTLTFIATANAIRYCGALPHFIDSEQSTFGIDPVKLAHYLAEIAELHADGCYNKQSGRKISAIVPMHVFGQPVDIDGLLAVADQWCIPVVEDAAESLGSTYRGKHCGRFGRIAALSFNGNKVITTGGGGAIVTDDLELGRRAKHLTTTARVAHKWAFIHDEVGYNYRMPNINAALGCAQLEQLDGFLASKRALTERYKAAFSEVGGLQFFQEVAPGRSNYWLNALVLDCDMAMYRDELLARTNAAGLMTRPLWTLMHRLPMYAECPRMDLSCAEDLEQRVVNIPSSAGFA